MKNNPYITLLVLSAFVLTLGGCLPSGGPSAPVHFYRLEYSPQTNKVTQADTAKSPSKLLIKVSSVEELHGSRITVADGAYELHYQEYERWAEPLSLSVGRLLVDDLQNYFATVQGVPVCGGYQPDYRIEVTLEKLWGTRHGDVILRASWVVSDNADHVLANGAQEFRKSGWKTDDYRQLAERISSTVPLLSQAIRDSIASLPSPAK